MAFLSPYSSIIAQVENNPIIYLKPGGVENSTIWLMGHIDRCTWSALDGCFPWLVFTITNAVITAPRLGFKRCKASFSLWSPPCYNDCRKCKVYIILTDAFFPIHTHLHYRLALLQSSIRKIVLVPHEKPFYSPQIHEVSFTPFYYSSSMMSNYR